MGKKCVMCDRNFPETKEYFVFRNDIQKFRKECKECWNLKSSEYHENHKNDIVYISKRRNKNHLYREKNPTKSKEYYQIHKNEIKEKNKTNIFKIPLNFSYLMPSEEVKKWD